MKRYIFVLIALLSTFTALAQSEKALYIYRNDGIINAFLEADIDSIRHSVLDLDSVMHAENVTQEVWTVDSVYRIPLAAIDSVSFVTPPTVYKQGVTRIEYNLLDYIIGADGLILKLRPDTPTMIIPVKGDKLVLLEGCEALPYGFSGIVTDMQYGSSSIDVVCEQAYLEDLFDSFCSVSTVFGCNPDSILSPSSRRRVTFGPYDTVLPLGPYQLSCSGEISQGIVPGGDLALSGGASFSVEIQPTFTIHTFLILGERQGTYFNCSITGNLRVSSNTSLYGGLSFSHDFDKVVRYYPIPHTAGLVNFYFNPGVFVSAEATITSKATTTHNYTFGMAFDFSSKGQNIVKPSVGGRLASSSVDMEGSLDGSIAGGGYIETGFSLVCREISRVCVRGEVGYRFSGNFVLRNDDIDNATKESELYERLKASSVEMGPFVNVGLYASVGNSEAKAKLELSHTDLKCDLVPTFSNTKLTKTPNFLNSADAYTELRGNCLSPVPVGYKLFDGDGAVVGDFDASNNYYNTASRMEHTFSGLEKGIKYRLYPKVNLWGHEILASPKAELNIVMPEIKEFRVTDSRYSKGAFYNDGQYYDYRFDAATTVEIESLEGVADWGYVYKDLNGNIKHISLIQFGSSYTDTRYAYFRNTPKSTCTLYGYVKYVGSDETIYGEPHDYPLIYNSDIIVNTVGATPSYTEAQCWGNASFSDGSNNSIASIVDECGFFYNLTGTPRHGNATKQSCSMDATGSFSVILSGLTEDTRYYYVAYVRIDNDYLYGETQTFRTKKKDNPEPIAITGEHKNEQLTSATIECTYKYVPNNADCGYYITKSYYGNASLGNRIPGGIEWDKVSIGRYEGTKEILLDNLMPDEDYQYYAYISVGNEDVATGTTKSFPTKSPKAHLFGEPKTSITSATVGYGFENVPEGGTCQLILLKVGDPIQNAQYISVSSTSNGNYTFAGLDASTSYQYFARIEYKTRKWDSDTGSFTTQTIPTPIVITGGHYNETLNSATIECTYVQIPTGTDCGYYLRGQKGSTLIESISISIGNIEGTKVINLSDLKAGTTYYYQAYAQYQGREYLGSENSFQTLTPNAVTGSYSNVTSNKANIVCGYFNVPEDAETGVILSYNGEEHEMPYNYGEGEHNIIIKDLYPETSYSYSAYIKYDNEIYQGEAKQFTTLTPGAYVGEATNVEEKSAQFEYGFNNVPEGGTCHVALQKEGSEAIDYSVSDDAQDVFPLFGLQPSATYTYWSYVEYYGETWSSDTLQFTTKTPPPPIATTGGYSDVTTNSAIVECSFENVPEGGKCYVYLHWIDDWGYNMGNSFSSSEGINKKITCSGLTPATTYYYTATISYDGNEYKGEEKSFTTKGRNLCPDENHPHAIDLGLPSGTKWCCCNVGASKPEDFGGYYTLGEVQQLGDSWQVPTQEQIYELYDPYYSSWRNVEKVNGVNGYHIKSRNGNELFIPAAGCYFENYNDVYYEGEEGEYWSSTFFPYTSDYGEWAYYWWFERGRYETLYNDHVSRYKSVRPVLK